MWPEEKDEKDTWIGPPNGKMDPSNGGPGYSGRGWIVEILPQMEQQGMYNAIMAGLKTTKGKTNWTPPRGANGYGMGAPEIREYIDDPLPWLACPSDPSAGVSDLLFHWTPIPVATTSYKGVLGDTVVWSEFTSHKDGTLPDCHNKAFGCNGLFWRTAYFKPVKLKSITDGQSNTLMIGESVVSQDFHAAAYFADGDWASCNVPLNFFLLNLSEQEIINQWYEMRGFRSLHPGGAQFAMADGSARFIQEGIDHKTYRALSTRDGDEVVTLQ